MNKENITKMVEACKRFERLHDADELFGERMSRMMDLESADQQFKMDWDALTTTSSTTTLLASTDTLTAPVTPRRSVVASCRASLARRATHEGLCVRHLVVRA